MTRAYDSLGRLIQETQNGWTVTRPVDGVGNPVLLAYPGGRSLSYDYDSAGRLFHLRESGVTPPLATYGYEGFGRLASRDMPVAGLSMDVGYDASYRVGSVTHRATGTGTVLAEVSSLWDRSGNRTRRTDGVRATVQQFTYDSGSQLMTSIRSQGGTTLSSVAYGTDGALNRQTMTGGLFPGTTTSTGVDALLNQVTTAPDASGGTEARSYDNAGHLASMSATSNRNLRYDFAGRLVEYEDTSSGVTTTYRYDAFGRRISKELDAGGGTVPLGTYVYWDRGCLEERDGGGTLAASYVRGPGIDELLSMRRGAVDTYYLTDDQGNVLGLTDASAILIESFDYDDFGTLLSPDAGYTPVSGSVTSNPYFFQGRRLDPESGLIDFRNRHLDPVTGRFVSPDPLGPWGDRVSRGNGFAFEGNNPWTYLDPLGLAVEGGLPPDPFSQDSFFPPGWPYPPIQDAPRVLGRKIPDPSAQITMVQDPKTSGGRRRGRFLVRPGEGRFLTRERNRRKDWSRSVPAPAPKDYGSGTPWWKRALHGADWTFRIFVFDYKEPIGGSYWLETGLALSMFTGDEGAGVRLGRAGLKKLVEKEALEGAEKGLAHAAEHGAEKALAARGGLPIRGFRGSKGVNAFHALDRAIERGVSPEAILHALKNPSVVVRQAGGRTLYLTKDAAVVLDRAGQAVTVWGGAQHGARTLDLLRAAGAIK